MDMPLFTRAGEQVTVVHLDMKANEHPPGIVSWQGRHFALTNGRYVESEVFNAPEHKV